MECFNSLLVKLREVHDREVEGWQMKMQELSTKKGCDTKRMEELFSKNQQMKEQQRLLTENIKTLENRLRAGLCDRCTVTQDVAKRRQHEFEATHIQSLQHISLLAGEINSLKKENKRLRDDLTKLRTAVESHSEHSSSSTSATEVKPNSSPDLSPSSGPVALVTAAAGGGGSQPADGDVVVVKSVPDNRSDDAERRQWRGPSRSNPESHKHLSAHASAPWKTEHDASHNAEKRARNESVEQQAFTVSQGLLPKNSPPPASREMSSSRHVLHTPVPCRPRPIKSSAGALTWPLSESADWGAPAAPGSSLLIQPSSKLSLPRFPNLIPPGQHAGPRRPGLGPAWAWPNAKANSSEPTVLFRLRGLSDNTESPNKPQEKREIPVSKVEKVPEEVLKEVHEGPLDLSDRGKSKPSLLPKDYSPSAVQGVERVQSNPDKDVKISASTHGARSSPHAVIPPSTSTSTAVKQQEDEAKVTKEQKDDANVKTEQSNGKKVPVLTISLRPVVVLESLNSALQKQDSSNGKSSPAAETGSSFDEEEEESASGQESHQGCKRKRASVETDTDRESDTDNIKQERKVKFTMRSEKSPG